LPPAWAFASPGNFPISPKSSFNFFRTPASHPLLNLAKKRLFSFFLFSFVSFLFSFYSHTLLHTRLLVRPIHILEALLINKIAHKSRFTSDLRLNGNTVRILPSCVILNSVAQRVEDRNLIVEEAELLARVVHKVVADGRHFQRGDLIPLTPFLFQFLRLTLIL